MHHAGLSRLSVLERASVADVIIGANISMSMASSSPTSEILDPIAIPRTEQDPARVEQLRGPQYIVTISNYLTEAPQTKQQWC
jgi:hypothetical protein